MGHEVGDRIRELRIRGGLSQQDLAGPGVTASYVSRLEAGQRQPSDRALSWIAGKLGTTPEFLAGGDSGRARHELRLDLAAAQMALEEGDVAGAGAKFARLRQSADADVAAEAARGYAAACEASGDLLAAIAAYEQLLEQSLASAAHSVLDVAVPLCRCCREAGDLGRAVDVGELGLRWLRECGAVGTDAEVELLLTLAMAYQERGDFVRTQQLLARVQAVADGLGGPRERGAVYWNAAVLAGELGRYADAVRMSERAVALFGEGSDERNLARLRNAHATLLMRHDPTRAGESLEMLQNALDRLLTCGSQVDVAYCETEIARAHVLLGDPQSAINAALSALVRLALDTRLECARARTALAFALSAAGRYDEAKAEYETAATLLERLGSPHQAALVWAELAECAASHGDEAVALSSSRRALSSARIVPPFTRGAVASRPSPVQVGDAG
ncbi:MAG: helix-turn-helix domain-containing protein [Frankiales bacterium]|nr:helix-turn-helix domain-containing protein [Frankiales bacterium]